jgi:hypothetical protein
MQELHGPRRLRLIGWQWELVRRISPTRPHPVVSRRPPGQVLSALPLTVLDRARDLLQRLDEASHCRFTAPISTADRLLATTTGAIERSRCCSGASGPRPAADSPPREPILEPPERAVVRHGSRVPERRLRQESGAARP